MRAAWGGLIRRTRIKQVRDRGTQAAGTGTPTHALIQSTGPTRTALQIVKRTSA
jgi:hypothetical protein